MTRQRTRRTASTWRPFALHPKLSRATLGQSRKAWALTPIGPCAVSAPTGPGSTPIGGPLPALIPAPLASRATVPFARTAVRTTVPTGHGILTPARLGGHGG